MTFDFDEYFTSLKKLNTNEKYMYDTMKYLVSKPNIDIISYKEIKKIIPNNLAYINKDENDKYYIEIELERTCDIITNFEISPNKDINISYKVSGKQVELTKDTKIIFVCAMYSMITIRFTFEKDPFYIIFSYDAYLAQNDIRVKLSKTKEIKLGNITYSGGVMSLS